MKKNTTVTNVSPINWKESFSSYPFIIVYSLEPIRYRIACCELSNDGKCLKILPSLNGTIDDMLQVFEGCLNERSNFRSVLEEYYGKDIWQLTEVTCDFNGINVSISKEMTAEEAKLQWLKNSLLAGYKNTTIHLTPREKGKLERNQTIRDLIQKYRSEL